MIFAKSGPEWTPLSEHAAQVKSSVEKFADYLGLDKKVAVNGALLHDIGKVHPYFQLRLLAKTNRTTVFRHEIASLFFLSAFPKEQWNILIEMVVAHHKSVKKDVAGLGLLDLEENDDYIDFHLGKWEEWSPLAISILQELGISCSDIPRNEAIDNLGYAIRFCENMIKQPGYSIWKGVMMGGDHFASSLYEKSEIHLERIFKEPNLSFYNRQHPLYPLSYKNSEGKKHTIVVASTGAGKTDYLFRRCKSRVFYTLPFQASINAMFERVGNDLEKDNPDIDIRLLHSTSIIVKRKQNEETSLQNLMGASVKILTPHQLASLAFGMKGYEALILDLKGCDVILDEVHTYSGVSQALVLKIIEVLKSIECRIHIGTATMPTVLYNKIKQILGDEDVLETKLTDDELDAFDRHIVHKVATFDDTEKIIEKAISDDQKTLIVFNTVKDAQDAYQKISNKYPNIPILLLHSRFRRCDRNIKEKQLLGLDETGQPTYEFNTSQKSCIAIATQIVEVSLDISFDVMITQCAPLDALIQRFGRINRKRTPHTIGKYKNVYVIAPPETEKDCRPYNQEIIKRSYEVLEDGVVLHERDLQQKLDEVFTDINFMDIEEHTIYNSDGTFNLTKLRHNGKAILFQLLEIDSVPCILEADRNEYENGDLRKRLGLEIQVAYWMVSKMEQSVKGHRPFIVPDMAYDFELGLEPNNIKNENLNVLNRFL